MFFGVFVFMLLQRDLL